MLHYQHSSCFQQQSSFLATAVVLGGYKVFGFEGAPVRFLHLGFRNKVAVYIALFAPESLDFGHFAAESLNSVLAN
jgi:hypothetical protein